MLSYSIELILITNTCETVFHKIAPLPKEFDPLSHTAELIRDLIPNNLFASIKSIGTAFPGKIEKNENYIKNSLVFPDFIDRSFSEELKLTLNMKNIKTFMRSYSDSEFIYHKYIKKQIENSMIIFLKQGITAKLHLYTWQKALDWDNLGHFQTDGKTACPCGNLGCLETLSGDIACSKKFAGKLSFEKEYINAFFQALDSKNTEAEKIFITSLELILKTVDVANTFRKIPKKIIFSSNISKKSDFILKNKTYSFFKKAKIHCPKIILSEKNSTVKGAAFANT